jgi:hypothetical protein
MRPIGLVRLFNAGCLPVELDHRQKRDERLLERQQVPSPRMIR